MNVYTVYMKLVYKFSTIDHVLLYVLCVACTWLYIMHIRFIGSCGELKNVLEYFLKNNIIFLFSFFGTTYVLRNMHIVVNSFGKIIEAASECKLLDVRQPCDSILCWKMWSELKNMQNNICIVTKPLNIIQLSFWPIFGVVILHSGQVSLCYWIIARPLNIIVWTKTYLWCPHIYTYHELLILTQTTSRCFVKK